MVGLAANERSTKQHTKVAKGGWPLWMGRLERMEDDIVFVGIILSIERTIEFIVFDDCCLLLVCWLYWPYRSKTTPTGKICVTHAKAKMTLFLLEPIGTADV